MQLWSPHRHFSGDTFPVPLRSYQFEPPQHHKSSSGVWIKGVVSPGATPPRARRRSPRSSRPTLEAGAPRPRTPEHARALYVTAEMIGSPAFARGSKIVGDGHKTLGDVPKVDSPRPDHGGSKQSPDIASNDSGGGNHPTDPFQERLALWTMAMALLDDLSGWLEELGRRTKQFCAHSLWTVTHMPAIHSGGFHAHTHDLQGLIQVHRHAEYI